MSENEKTAVGYLANRIVQYAGREAALRIASLYHCQAKELEGVGASGEAERIAYDALMNAARLDLAEQMRRDQGREVALTETEMDTAA